MNDRAKVSQFRVAPENDPFYFHRDPKRMSEEERLEWGRAWNQLDEGEFMTLFNRVDHRWADYGSCPTCGQCDGYRKTGGELIGFCLEHRTKWSSPLQHGGESADETALQRLANRLYLFGFREVKLSGRGNS